MKADSQTRAGIFLQDLIRKKTVRQLFKVESSIGASMNPTIHPLDDQTKSLYRLAAIAALLIAAAGIIDVLTSMGSTPIDNRAFPTVEWFQLFQTHPFTAFSRLGLINMITLSLCTPIYAAYIRLLKRDRPLVLFTTFLFFIGVASYLSSNTVLPLYALSREYATASASQQPLLEAAGLALLAQGADLTSGTFIGLFLPQIAGILVSSILLKTRVFGKWVGPLGLAGFSIMAVFFILTAFFPRLYDTAILISAPGGLILLSYQVILALKFFQMSNSTQERN
jgi:hypothetical protein